MGNITFIVGGARSGKSRYAQELARSFGSGIAFIATGQAKDEEMKLRIRRHQQERPREWTTVEEAIDVAGAVASLPAGISCVIVDCLTLWVSNRMLAGDNSLTIEQQSNRIMRALKETDAESIVISNEVGMGIVPDNALAREFRDIAGIVNQIVAAGADNVILMAAGIPLKLK